MHLCSNISWFSSRAPLHQHEGPPWGSSPWWTCRRLPGSDRAPPLANPPPTRRAEAPSCGGGRGLSSHLMGQVITATVAQLPGEAPTGRHQGNGTGPGWTDCSSPPAEPSDRFQRPTRLTDVPVHPGKNEATVLTANI